MDFPQNMSMEEAFALAEAEARLNAALQESKERFNKAAMPDRLNEDWRFGRPNVFTLQDMLANQKILKPIWINCFIT